MGPQPRQSAATALTRRAALAGVALGWLADPAHAADVVDRLGIPGPLAFDGTSYGLAWSAHPSPTYFKQEYLPAGQVSASYDSMLIVEVLDGGASVQSALAAQVRLLNQRKGKDPLVKLDVIQNSRTGEALLDFLISARNAKGVEIVEWNAYRYVPRKAGDGREGVMLFAVSRRAYGDDKIRGFLTDLKTKRPADINRLARHALPTARIAR
ncbi:hypothetical protein [Bosea sp. 124]|uniref:hypothetical protein n=1 Tax=Bosea sp. 124 TaxID=2135642 RepID=UPI000D400D47|nr:hypothetical protein [Bosea sp. 124]PTM42344.1 hypothetical protein C8D03_3931 [Bosea sp. 124]